MRKRLSRDKVVFMNESGQIRRGSDSFVNGQHMFTLSICLWKIYEEISMCLSLLIYVNDKPYDTNALHTGMHYKVNCQIFIVSYALVRCFSSLLLIQELRHSQILSNVCTSQSHDGLPALRQNQYFVHSFLQHLSTNLLH